MRRLRIAYAVGTLSPGGAERQMMALAERLPADRFRPSFIEFSGPGPYATRAAAMGIPVITLGQPPVDSGTLGRIHRRIAKTVAYGQAVRAGRYDIVDAWLYPAYVIAAVARPWTRTPIIVAGRRNLGDLRDRLGPIEDVADIAVRRMTDAVVANSRAVADDALRRGEVRASKLRVIHNGVESIPPPTTVERQRIRAGWGAGEADIVIGAVGNLRAVKGHEYLLPAFAAAAADDQRLRLVIVGEGPERPAIEAEVRERAIGDRVHLAGSVLDPQELYGGFDMVVHPSLSEGLSNTLLEAASAGRPIIATSVGGTAEIIHDEQTGLLIAPADIAALSHTIVRLAANPGLRRRLGDTARTHVQAKFGMGRYVDEFAALYEELAGRAKLSL